MMSPFVLRCLASFGEAYSLTGMNIVQSIVLVIVAAVSSGWRALSGRGSL
jgi:hypothetical protein